MKANCVLDYLRINFTRFRTSSHRLRIETGRWSRIPHEQRLCECGEGVQNEQHIMTCPLLNDIRRRYDLSADMTFDEFIRSEKSKSDLSALHEMM